MSKNDKKWGKAETVVEQPVKEIVKEIEAQPVTKEEPCVCDETCVCEEPCADDACVCDKPTPEIVEAVSKFINDSIIEELKVIEKPKTKSFAQMTATEINIYHKTGILPLL